VAPSLLDADNVQPGRGLGNKLDPRDESRTPWLPVSASHLRGYGEEEFVDATLRYESAEQSWAAFMEKERYAEFRAQKFQHRSWRDDGTFERPDFRRDQRSYSACHE